MATRTIANGGGIWTDDSTWVEGVAPTSADDVVATGTSGNVTISSVGACRNVDFANYVGTITQSANLQISGNAAFAPTIAAWNRSAGAIQLLGTGAQTFRSNGFRITAPISVGAGAGTYTLLDALDCSFSLTLSSGTFNDGGFAVTLASGTAFICTGSTARTLVASGTWTLTSTSTSNIWNVAGSNFTITAPNVTINITGNSANVRTFIGGGATYGTVSYNAASAAITGANTFASIIALNGGGRTFTFPAATTTTSSALSLSGTIGGTQLTVASSSGGSAAVVSIAAGTQTFNNTTIQDITAQGGATYRAFSSSNISGNTGITFVTGAKLALTGVG